MEGLGYYPSEPMIRSLIAKNLAAAGKKAEAEEALRPVLLRNPNFAPALAVARRAGLASAGALRSRIAGGALTAAACRPRARPRRGPARRSTSRRRSSGSRASTTSAGR